MKVTPTKCIDGKRHRWKEIGGTNIHIERLKYILKWCSKCGSITEFVCKEWCGSKKFQRCTENDNSYYIEIPICHKDEEDLKREKRERLEQMKNELEGQTEMEVIFCENCGKEATHIQELDPYAKEILDKDVLCDYCDSCFQINLDEI